jgi:hypothetical protein
MIIRFPEPHFTGSYQSARPSASTVNGGQSVCVLIKETRQQSKDRTGENSHLIGWL